MLVELLVVLALVLLNGVLAGAEIAIVSMRGTRVDQLVASGSKGARAVAALRGDPERFLATVQVGITVVSATTAAFGGATFARKLAPLLERLPGVGESAEQLAFAAVVAVISYLSVVLGELVPKSLGMRWAERYALVAARPLQTLAWLGRPLVWFLTASSNVVLRIFGDRTNFTEGRLSRDELRQMVEHATRSGDVEPGAGSIASRALAFAELTALQMMIPRERVFALPLDAGVETIRGAVLEQGFRRMPVYRTSLDDLAGYVTANDAFAVASSGGARSLESAVRPALFVQSTSRAADLLATMRRGRTQLAIVTDELGTTIGIVTAEDVLEELVGEILSEDEPDPKLRFRRDGDGAIVIRADAPVHDLNRELHLHLPESAEYATVGGLCIKLAGGRIPRVDDRFELTGGGAIEVLEASPRKVHRVRIVAPAPAPADGDASLDSPG